MPHSDPASYVAKSRRAVAADRSLQAAFVKPISLYVMSASSLMDEHLRVRMPFRAIVCKSQMSF